MVKFDLLLCARFEGKHFPNIQKFDIYSDNSYILSNLFASWKWCETKSPIHTILFQVFIFVLLFPRFVAIINNLLLLILPVHLVEIWQ